MLSVHARVLLWRVAKRFLKHRSWSAEEAEIKLEEAARYVRELASLQVVDTCPWYMEVAVLERVLSVPSGNGKVRSLLWQITSSPPTSHIADPCGFRRARHRRKGRD